MYFAEKAKAQAYARKAAEFDPGTGTWRGLVLKCNVDLGHCKTATWEPCPAPHKCNKSYVDHLGYWSTRQGYDSVYLRPKSLPATHTEEWCVADPARVTLRSFKYVTLESKEQGTARPRLGGV